MRTSLLAALLLSTGAIFGQGIVTTLSGTGFPGYSGDFGPALNAQLYNPQAAAVDPSGNIYFADLVNFRIRKISPQGFITTIAGTGVRGTTGDGGLAIAAKLGFVRQVAVDAAGHVCFGDEDAHKVRCIFPMSGNIIVGFGTGNPLSAGDGGSIANASFYDPVGMALDNSQLYISDFAGNVVRRADLNTGIITALAGPGPGFSGGPLGDGAPATSANIYQPAGLLVANGALYIADQGNFRVRRVDLSTGIITTVAGSGSPYPSGDGGPATAAGLNPFSIAADGAGNLFIAANPVRMVDTLGNITTIAGNGNSGSGTDDIPATQTTFGGLNGIAWDPIAHRLLLVDGGNNRIRQIFYTTPTTTTLTATPNPAPPGPVTLQAVVSPSTAIGVVRFYDGGLLLGSGNLSNGVALYNWSSAPVGTHTLHAVYGGDATYNLSSSDPLTLPVQTASSTTTSITTSQNPSTSGQSVTFTASVTPSAATGQMRFYDTDVLAGTVTLTSGVATFTTAALTPGVHIMNSTYAGDAVYGTSLSPTIVQTVLANSSVSLWTNAPSPIPGQNVAFNATVTPATATGTVQFLDGTTVLGTGTIASGVATFSTSTLALGAHSLTGVYAGDAAVAASTSPALNLSVKAPVGLSLSASANPILQGQPVTFTATITPATATGTVQFLDNGTAIGTGTLASGIATFTTSSLALGAHPIGMQYSGDETHLSAGTSTTAFTVVATSTIAVAASQNPSAAGQSVTFTATIVPATATGSVQFLDNGAIIGSAPLAGGSAAVSSSTLTVGTHSITVSYPGDANVAASTSAPLAHTVNRITAALTMTSSANPSLPQQPVTFSAAITPATATGTVQFLDGATALGTATLASGSATFTTTSLTAGAHSITVTYAGDATVGTATSAPLTQTVNKTTSILSLASNPNPSLAQQAVIFSAAVTPPTATGTVQFFDGAALLGNATLASGSASFATTSLGTGTHSIHATYSGDAPVSAATSASLTQVVKAAAVVTIASNVPNPVPGQSLTFLSTISPSTATGTVQFRDNGANLGTVSVTSGTAVFSTSALGLGSHSITAVYSGDPNTTGGTSSALVFTVKSTASVTIASSPNPSNQGQNVTLVATVTPQTATGTVQFRDGGSAIGTANVSGGRAILNTSALSGGTHSISALYSGDATRVSANSSALVQSVKVNSSTAVTSSLNPSPSGQAVTFTIGVTPSSATGTVQLKNGNSTLGTVTLSNGTGTLTTSSLSSGSHSITAVYSGDSLHNASTSPSLAQTVKAATTLTLTSSPNPANRNGTVTFLARINPGAATGQVQFFDGNTLLGTANLSGGVATFSSHNWTSGTHPIHAVYAGNSTYDGDTSPVLNQVIR